ncbi:class I SAM-dependent DNA methyltransferase [Rothia amarae]|uniref:site-specific DNA-methyltransferase (adenine-specific) n=1 Tax=Rothia amarae TaxID=169480 RepID=A0A7H2BIX5_9MICC|nr:class I SAM-dependent DNA methyltransferase [Rothia amarae]QNV39621.1 class I SAM-dependent DNA methyltransferase [Rothia amarae]
MAKLSVKAIETRVDLLVQREREESENHHDFIFDLLLAYGKPKSTVSRLKNGVLNVALEPATEVALKNVVYFRELLESEDALEEIERLREAAHVVRYSPRFIIVSDYSELLARDTKTGETLAIDFLDFAKHFAFFLPWAGMEKTQYISEAHADVKAAERMGKLFDELLRANPYVVENDFNRHTLNIFFTRLLFCFFAEDTNIFKENQFTNAVGSFTQKDGSDTQEFLTALFEALDTPDAEDKEAPFKDFPYVNGRLFAKQDALVVPQFTAKARQHLVELGTLQWQEINPDIFGSMFQAIVTPGKRSDLGQHYTSVPNILKTIEPLFLDELREEFDAAFDNVKKLEALLKRISAIKIFDPACGSGNFLVIAYKELRRLEHAILERLADIGGNKHSSLFADSRISIENFFGIEIDDFAAEVAVLSLWIAKHQMNMEFTDKFKVEIPLIPLRETGQIKEGNAARIDWNEVCPNDGKEEIYLIGNPPYLGSRNQGKEQKTDLKLSTSNFKSLDYVCIWFIKGSEYINKTVAQLSFVATNSITQGEQVSLLWKPILSKNIEIGYAYSSFKWSNSAKKNAGVICVVINLRNKGNKKKYIFSENLVTEVKNITPYVTESQNVWISRRSHSISPQLPQMGYGSMPNDGSNLILTTTEKEELLSCHPYLDKIIKKFYGADQYINGKERYCLWIEDENLNFAHEIKPISQRLEKVRQVRINSTEKSTQAMAIFPHKFYFSAYKPTDSIIVPRVSSERREYIPIGYLGADTVISDAAFAVYDAEPWLFALLTSRLHMAWVRSVGGKLKTDYRYSNTLVYNNFPVPHLTPQMKTKLTEVALRVLDVREYHCENTLAELYDPDKMPADLREAHTAVDKLVDSLYSKTGFENDEDRLAKLFDLYQKQVAEEEAKAPKKSTRRKKTT